MKRLTLIALTIAAVAAVTVPMLGNQTYAATRHAATATAAQNAVKGKDSPQVQRAKAAQRTKAAKKQVAPIPAGLTGTWAIGPAHSRIGFAVRHVLVNDVHGNFNEFEGTINANGQDITKSSVEFKAKIASIDTNVPQRDAHLKSADFFDAEKYPEMTFRSTRIERSGQGFRAIGPLTMHGTSKTIAIPFRLRGPVVDGFGYARIGVEADLQLNRQDYAVKYHQVLDNGGLAVDNIVRVSLDLEAVKAGSGPKNATKDK